MKQEKQINKCQFCKREFEKEQLITFDGARWCEDCLDEETIICNDCRERVYRDGIFYINDDYPVCEICHDNNYFHCDICGCCYHNDCYGDDGICQYCLEEESNRPTTYPDNQRYYSKSRQDLAVGVEIEAENGDYRKVYDDLVNQGFGVCTDGSLSSRGIEIQVPASNLGNTEKLVRQACFSLAKNGFEISKKCGLHVHIEYKSRFKTIKHLLLMIYACEPVFYAINPKSRQQNSFCQPLLKAFSVSEILRAKAQEIDKLFYSKRYSHLTTARIKDLKKEKFNHCRYFGFNLHSLFYQKTVEFRYHAGTINPDKILNWINLLKAILCYVRFNYNKEDVWRLMEQPSVLNKIKYLKQRLKLKKSLASYLISRYLKFHNHVRNN